MCQSRDGEVYPMSEKTVGFNYPPLHPRCRSTVAPYIEGAGRLGTRIARVNGRRLHVSESMRYSEFKEKYLQEKTLDKTKLERKSKNQGAFAGLQVPMQLKSVKQICSRYGVDLTGLTIKIQRSEELLRLPIAGMTDYNNVGRIDLAPNAFKSEKELLKTLIHEKLHVKQLKKYGKEYVQANIMEMERVAYRGERLLYEIVRRKVSR